MAAHDHEKQVEETDTEARQANHRQMNFRVLLISMAAVAALMLIVYLVFFIGAPPAD